MQYKAPARSELRRIINTMKEHRSRLRSNAPKVPSGAASSDGRQAGTARKAFAVFDIDGTLIRWQLYHAMADALAKNGHIEAGTYSVIRNARLQWKQRTGPQSFKDYELQIIRAYEKALLVLSDEQLNQAVDNVFDEYKDQVYIFTRDLIKKLKAKGYLLFAISGSQSEIIGKVTEYYGFDDFVGTQYKVVAGKLDKVFNAADKKKVLAALVTKHDADHKDSFGVGDSASDIPMLEAVQNPIVFNPEKVLFEHAKSKGWKIIIERKNMVYELEKKNGKYVLAKTS